MKYVIIYVYIHVLRNANFDFSVWFDENIELVPGRDKNLNIKSYYQKVQRIGQNTVMPQCCGSLHAILLNSSQKVKNTKICPDRRNKKTELEEVQRTAAKLSKFMHFLVNWDAGSCPSMRNEGNKAEDCKWMNGMLRVNRNKFLCISQYKTWHAANKIGCISLRAVSLSSRIHFHGLSIYGFRDLMILSQVAVIKCL